MNDESQPGQDSSRDFIDYICFINTFMKLLLYQSNMICYLPNILFIYIPGKGDMVTDAGNSKKSKVPPP